MEKQLSSKKIILTLFGFVIFWTIVTDAWGYNSLANIVSHRKAAIISTVFFVLLHWSAYFIKLYRFGAFDFVGLIGQSISALIWGLVCCWLLKKGKTLWNPILAHTLYDKGCVLFIGGN